MTRRISILLTALLLSATAATAGPNWQTISFSTTPANAPKVVAALEKLMTSEAGKKLTGSVSLMANVAGGNSSHTIISAFDTRAAREVWTRSLQADPAWAAFATSTSGLIVPSSTSRMDFVKSWGDENPKDVLWEIFAFSVTDPAAFVAAIDTLMASPTGKKFPGQVHLSAVAASGLTPVTHLISVGFESEAESEAWGDPLVATKEWAAYLRAAGMVSKNEGGWMIRTLKTWGNTDN